MENFEEALRPFHFELEPKLIASYPAPNRDESRLMILNRRKEQISIKPHFRDISSFLHAGDLIVFNDSRVSKRRLYLQSEKGREHECLFLEKQDQANIWKCMLRKPGKLKKGDILKVGGTSFHFLYNEGKESFIDSVQELDESFFETYGAMPIPPYLKRKAESLDETRYQSIFAKEARSVAAPTAALHFSPELKMNLEKVGIDFCPVSLDIGYGTFSPLDEEQWKQKKLHKEKYFVSKQSSKLLNQAKKEKRRIISLGTTSLRVLESIYDNQTKTYRDAYGETQLFLRPGDKIESIQGLITNFHLPGSSLLLLVAAFCGQEFIMEAYRTALQERMRFFSYGDAMFIY